MEDNVNKSKQLEQDTIDFAVSVVRYTDSINLPKQVASQLIRSATSIGANYAEALNASSKTDFRNKIYIAKKEASETRYWLKVCAALTKQNVAINKLLIERSSKFLLIFQKTVNTINDQRKIKDLGSRHQ